MTIKNKKILLVEDEAIIALNHKVNLQKYGYEVVIAHSGEKAIKTFLEDGNFDLILMDIDLGKGIDGPETATRILEKKEIPVVFLSNHTEPEVVEKTEKITSYGYVVKNSGITVLDASIKMAFKLFDANDELKLSKDKLEATLNALPDMLFEFDIDGLVYDCHAPRSETMINKKEDIIGNNVYDLLPTNAAETIMNAIKETNEKGFSIGKQFEMNVPKGNLWFEISLSRKVNEVELRFIMLRRDITLRKKAEKELLEKEKLLQETQVLAKVGSWTWDVTNNSVWWSKQLYDIMRVDVGCSLPNDLSFEKYCTNDSWIALTQAVNKSIAEGVPFELELDFIKADGEISHTFTKGNCVKDKYGKIERLYGSIQDITEKKVEEKRLHEINEQFRVLTTLTPVGVYLTDYDRNCLYANPAWCEMAGISKEDALNQGWIEGIHPDDREKLFENWQNMVSSKGKVGLEYRFQSPDGKITNVFGMAVPQYDELGNIIHFIGVNQDITDRKKGEDEIKSLLSEKELLLKEVHHRLKNNMNTLKSLLALHAQTMKDPLSIAALKDAGSRVQGMMVVYDKLYQSNGLYELSAADFLSIIVDEIVSNFPNGKSVKINKDICDVIIDSKKVQPLVIIINELLTNIMKYAFGDREDGIISISTSINENRFSLIIEDNGNGMPESISFENSKSFGLMLVDLLTKQIKGTIRIERINGLRVILEFDR